MLAEQRLYSLIEDSFGAKRDWYRIHDSNPQLKADGAKWIKPEEAEEWNRRGWGIFQTINCFRGQRRKENLAHINAWAVDIDSPNKGGLLKRIQNAPLFPSLVVETRNGFHVYWNALRATKETYDAIVVDRLIPYFGADEKAKDMARLLRVPGYFHQKDPKQPYLISVRAWNPCAYTEGDMLYAFPLSSQKKMELKVKQEFRSIFTCAVPESTDDLWESIYNMDCHAALERLSGSPFVGGETYSFKRVSSGNLNIYVNGKSTSCFIDKCKRIGSMDHGGPTVFNWLKWFGRSNSQVVEIMKEVYPELWKRS